MMPAKQISRYHRQIISLALRIVGLEVKMLVNPLKLGQGLVSTQVVLAQSNSKLDRTTTQRLTQALKHKVQTRLLVLSQPQL